MKTTSLIFEPQEAVVKNVINSWDDSYNTIYFRHQIRKGLNYTGK